MHSILADFLKSSTGDPIIAESIIKYDQDYTFTEPRSIPDLQTVQALISAISGPTGPYLTRDGLNSPIAEMNWGGYGVKGMAYISDTTPKEAINIGARDLKDLNELTVANWYDRSNGFRVTTNGFFASQKTSLLAANETFLWPNKGGLGGTIAMTSDIENHFKGYFVSLVALQTAFPTADPGDYATVDAGVGVDAKTYIWDDDDSDWVLSSGTGGVASFNGRIGSVMPQAGDYTTSIVAEGSNLYYTSARFNTAFSAKSTSDLSEGTNLYFTEARAIASPITGFSSSAGTLAPTDSILQSINKLDGNIATKANLTGSDKQIIYNSGGTAFAASADFTFDNTAKIFSALATWEQTISKTGVASFTITGGATTINTNTITYSANTSVKVGDTITGTGIQAGTYIFEVLSATSSRISRRATATGSSLTFTIRPATFAYSSTYDFTNTAGNSAGGAFFNYTQNNTSPNGRAILAMAKGPDGSVNGNLGAVAEFIGNTPQLILTAPGTAGAVASSWVFQAGYGTGTPHGQLGIGVVGTATPVFQFTSAGNLALASISSASGTTFLNLNGGASTSSTYQSVRVSYNQTLVPTAGSGVLLAVGNVTGGTGAWNPTTGSASLDVISSRISINQTGSASGGVQCIVAEPAVSGLTGFLRGLVSLVPAGSGTRHNIYVPAGATNGIVPATTFGSLSAPNSATLIDMISTTQGLGLPSMTAAQRTAIGARNGNVVYQNDGTQGVYAYVNGAWAAIGGGASILRASKACTAEDGGTITAWTATTDFTYTITVTGATTGQNVAVNLDDAMASTIITNTVTLLGWVSAANTVKVRVRTTSYINVTGNITVAVF